MTTGYWARNALTLLLAVCSGMVRAQAPAIFEVATLVAGDAEAADGFGVAVAIDDRTVVVGAPSSSSGGLDTGAAYVFEKAGDGAWTQTAKLLPSDRTPCFGFGSAVAVHGNTIVVGRRERSVPDTPGVYDGPCLPNSSVGRRGAVYAFQKTPDGWIETLRITGNRIGLYVSVDTDSIAYNSPRQRAVIYHRDGTGTWFPEAELPASGQIFDSEWSGPDVELAGNTALVIAPNPDSQTRNVAAAFADAYERDMTGNWIRSYVLNVGSAAAAISGRLVLSGRNGADGRNLYRRAADGAWESIATLEAIEPTGVAVDVDETSGLAIVGRTVFNRVTDNDWREAWTLAASNGAGIGIGSHSVSGHTVIASGRGAAYVFEIPAAVVSEDQQAPEFTELRIAPEPIFAGRDGYLVAVAYDGQVGVARVSSMEYRVADGPWQRMIPMDGSFGETWETALGFVGPFFEPGSYEVCARATDNAGNVSAPNCLTTTVRAPGTISMTGAGRIAAPPAACVDACWCGAAEPDMQLQVDARRTDATINQVEGSVMLRSGGLTVESEYLYQLFGENGRATLSGSGIIRSTTCGYSYADLVVQLLDGASSTNGSPDKARIIIRTAGIGTTIYDSALGGLEDLAPEITVADGDFVLTGY
jgi:hypothetical protein